MFSTAISQLRATNKTIRVLSEYHPLSATTHKYYHRMFHLIADLADLNYTIVGTETGKNGTRISIVIGSYNGSSQTWSGCLGNLTRGEADVFLAHASITPLRNRHFDFLPPLAFDFVRLVTSADDGSAANTPVWSVILEDASFSSLANIFEPFLRNVWFGISTALILMTILHITMNCLRSVSRQRTSYFHSQAMEDVTLFLQPLFNQAPTWDLKPSLYNVTLLTWSMFAVLITACTYRFVRKV